MKQVSAKSIELEEKKDLDDADRQHVTYKPTIADIAASYEHALHLLYHLQR